ncbi:uncharacterized protein BT62DRAFT_959841 [Guyanagaster necrorhizus]|uniref:T6SS Phospholipase effector Tle1-like catalytic domain-containing protein n=1 Tax=Guyanagaster necrorhizus TaxID=856835 RepID=A0A9P7W3K1_9AGAR|nr:uncharacterized protein BT62DRAFT_959841 [Guyanagaster necrorhizus MCA 3950]KAG7451929.1 hypothetical protein BT62DRAFT_959841 [Guyanagaster necrorhizus MCA 3950]
MSAPSPQSTSEQTPPNTAAVDVYPEFRKVASPSADRYSFQGYTLEETIPPRHSNRTLVLCFDGTGDQFDSDNSNVVNFFSLLKKDDPSTQLVYYQAGIGTYSIPEIASPITAKLSRMVDSMIGIHLDAHVMGGYEFLMQNYEAEDKICIFGFSRGAYTARALAGMIHKIGLLPRCNHQQVPFAYRMYSREDELGWAQSAAFKKAFSIDVDIHFLGVWDTVDSVGIIPRRLPFTASNTHVRHFRHALSLDERRVRFIPALWHRIHPSTAQLGVQPGEMPKPQRRRKPHSEKTLDEHEQEYEAATVCHQTDTPTDVEEVWFAGCHCDIGGGSVANEVPNSLARIPFRWMIRQCFLLKTGIMFHRELLKNFGIEPSTLYPEVKPRPPPITSLPPASESNGDVVCEETEDLRDALCPLYDQLSLVPAWWILELLPAKVRYQKKDDTWAKTLTLNGGRPRHIPRQKMQGIKVHRTVKLRIESEDVAGGKYVPKADWTVEPTWVD